jgi:hypothetical protein
LACANGEIAMPVRFLISTLKPGVDPAESGVGMPTRSDKGRP